MEKPDIRKLSGSPYEYNIEVAESLLKLEVADADILMHLVNTFAFCNHYTLQRELMSEKNINWVKANEQAKALYEHITSLRPKLRELLDFSQSRTVQAARKLIQEIGQEKIISENEVESILANLLQGIETRKQAGESVQRLENLLFDFEQKITANKTRLATREDPSPLS